MTEQEKQRIAVMRSEGEGYKEIAKVLHISLNTVQTFCRRNHLTGKRSGSSAPEDLSIKPTADGLISASKDGNSNDAKAAGHPRNSGAKRKERPVVVTLEFADEPDETAVKDVLRMLTEGRW